MSRLMKALGRNSQCSYGGSLLGLQQGALSRPNLRICEISTFHNSAFFFNLIQFLSQHIHSMVYLMYSRKTPVVFVRLVVNRALQNGEF